MQPGDPYNQCATHLKAHRTAAKLLEKRVCSPTYPAHEWQPELEAARRM
jgi:hypothetical protein